MKYSLINCLLVWKFNFNSCIKLSFGFIGCKIVYQLKKVIDAYVSKNKNKANEVRNSDQLIDQQHQAIYLQLIDEIKSKPNKIKTLMNTKLLFTIKTIERAGDHITNISEEIYYAITGETLDSPRPKGDLDL